MNSLTNCYIYFGLLFIHILKLTKFRNHVLQIQLATWPQNLHHCAIDNLLSWGKSNKTDLHLPRIMLLYEKFHMPLRLLEFWNKNTFVIKRLEIFKKAFSSLIISTCIKITKTQNVLIIQGKHISSSSSADCSTMIHAVFMWIVSTFNNFLYEE